MDNFHAGSNEREINFNKMSEYFCQSRHFFQNCSDIKEVQKESPEIF